MKTIILITLLFLTVACGNPCHLYSPGIGIGFEFADPNNLDSWTFTKMPFEEAIQSREAQNDYDTQYVSDHYSDLDAGLADKNIHARRITWFNQLKLNFQAFQDDQALPYPYYDCH